MSSVLSTSRPSGSTKASRSAACSPADPRPPTPALAHLSVDDQGFGWLPEDDFVNHFAADVDPVRAKVMHAVQQPLHTSALDAVNLIKSAATAVAVPA